MFSKIYEFVTFFTYNPDCTGLFPLFPDYSFFSQLFSDCKFYSSKITTSSCKS